MSPLIATQNRNLHVSFYTDFVSATFSTFLSPSCILLCNPVHRFSYTTTVENDHDNVLRVFLFFFFFLYLVPLCIFRVLLKKRQKTNKKNFKKRKKNTRVNANMQLCLFIPIGMIQCWFGMVHKQLRCLQKVDWGGI